MRIKCDRCGHEQEVTPDWLSKGGKAKGKKGFAGRPDLLQRAISARKPRNHKDDNGTESV